MSELGSLLALEQEVERCLIDLDSSIKFNGIKNALDNVKRGRELRLEDANRPWYFRSEECTKPLKPLSENERHRIAIENGWITDLGKKEKPARQRSLKQIQKARCNVNQWTNCNSRQSCG